MRHTQVLEEAVVGDENLPVNDAKMPPHTIQHSYIRTACTDIMSGLHWVFSLYQSAIMLILACALFGLQEI
jgi:hypothetical protein